MAFLFLFWFSQVASLRPKGHEQVRNLAAPFGSAGKVLVPSSKVPNRN